MKGFGIYIKNDLLEPKHVKNMGEAYWLYTWCLDKMTSVSEEGIGIVLHGNPIKYEVVKLELGVSRRTYIRWVERLREYGYINTTTASHGLIISVNKAVKVFGNSGVPKMSDGVTEVAQEMGGNGTPHIYNNTVNNTIQKENPSGLLADFLKSFNSLFSSKHEETDGRRKKLTARLKRYTFEQILTALQNISQSDFHKGQNTRGWKADPDFLLRNDEQIDKWLNWKKAETFYTFGANGQKFSDDFNN